MNRDHKRLEGILLVAAASVCYGLMPSVTQTAYKAGLSIETMLADRYMVATTIIWLYLAIRKTNWRISRTQLSFLFGVGIVYIGVAVFINLSYMYLPGAITTILVFTYVSIVVLLELVTRREKPNGIKLLCVGLSLTGLILVIKGPGGGELSLIGILFALATGVCYAIYAFSLGGKITAKLDSMVMIGYILIIPTIAYVIRCLSAGEPMLPETRIQTLCVFFLAFFSTFLGSILFCKAIKIIGSGNASIVNTMEPVVAYFGGMLLMGDVLDYTAILGGILILASIILLNLFGGGSERAIPER